MSVVRCTRCRRDIPAWRWWLHAWRRHNRRRRCHCGRTFWTRGGYRDHYALVHILELD